MDPFPVIFVVMVLFGCLLGTITGLIPGLHVNNVALILLGLMPTFVALLSPVMAIGLDMGDIALLMASTVVALSITHTFLDFIPSAFIGAPESDTALSVLPAHQMLLEGRGYEAVYLSALGSFTAVVIAAVLLLPYRFIFGPPIELYNLLKNSLLYVLTFVVMVLLLTESGQIPYVRKDGGGWETGRFSNALAILCALGLFLVSGMFGLMALALTPMPLIPMAGATMLFPALSGAFGVATIVDSLRTSTAIPPQHITIPKMQRTELLKNAALGTTAGSVVGFLPGMTAAQATVLAMLGRRERRKEHVILTLSAINTANAFFVLAAMFLILKARSGAAIVVMSLIDVDPWAKALPPPTFPILVASAIIAATVGFALTIAIGKRAARIFTAYDYRRISIAIVVFICFMTLLFTGPIGLLVLATSTLLGLIPPNIGIRRTHLMGMLLLPVMLYLWG